MAVSLIDGVTAESDLLAAAFAAAAVGLAVLDESGRLVHANPRFCSMLGRTHAEVIGRSWLELVASPATVPAWRDASGDLRLRRKDGTLVPCRAELQSIGRASAVTLTEIERSEARYRHIIENAGEGLLIVGRDRMPLLGNPKLEQLTGYSLAEIYRTPFDTLVWDEDRPAMLERFDRRMAGEHLARTYEFRIRKKDGSPAWMQVSATHVDWDGVPAILAFISDITKRREAEETLRASVQQYRDLVTNTAEGIVIVIGDRFAFVNPSFSKLLGAPAEALVGRSIAEIIHPDDLAGVRERRERFSRGERVPPQHSFRVFASDGRAVWIEVSTVPIQFRGKAATLSFLTDVTERKRLQDELTRSLEERETILENSIVGIVFVNDRGRIAWANRAAHQMFDCEADAMAGRSIEEFYLSREEFVATRSQVSASVRAGRSFEIEQELRSAHGRVFWVFVSGKSVSPSDQSKGTVWSIIDISARKRLEEELRRASAEREAILENTLVGIAYLHGRNIQWANRRFAEQVGCTPEEMIGRSMKSFAPEGESYEQLEATANRAMCEAGHFRIEHPIRRSDGAQVWMEIYGTFADRKLPERGSIWTLLDIADRRKAQEDMQLALEKQRELGDLKSRFVAMSSHELRTPLAAIQSSAELIRDYGERLAAAERAELLDIVTAAVRRMSYLLEDVLAIGKADAGRLELAPATVDLTALCEAIVEESRTAARDAGAPEVAVRLAIAGPRREAHLDEKLLRHILGNLLSNAMKYSLAGGEVRIDVACEPGRTVFAVTDHGIGIPREDLPHLFETFHRATNVRNIAGTGLGLAIVKRAVDRHGGTIEVASEIGRGTRFVVTIPDA